MFFSVEVVYDFYFTRIFIYLVLISENTAVQKKSSMAFFAKVMLFSVFAMIITSVRRSESTEVTTSSQSPVEPKSTKPTKSLQSSEETERPLPGKDLDWRTIRNENFLYIDKTTFLVKLLEEQMFCRLNRPHGFGKTMFVDMMADFFRGKEEMFEGLLIGKEGNTRYFKNYISKAEGQLPKWMEFPVIHLNFGEIGHFKTWEEFKGKFLKMLEDIASSYNINSTMSYFDFSHLITALSRKFNGIPVFILVDEYDHPSRYALLTLNNRTVAKSVKYHHNWILDVIEIHRGEIGLAFLTGVSQLSPPNIPCCDLTFNKDFAGAFGFSDSEIKKNLGPYMIKFAQNISTAQRSKNASDDHGSLEDKIFNELKFWYDGYQFAEENDACRVLNPISTLESLKNQEFRSYWTSTYSIDYLVRELHEMNCSLDFLKKSFPIYREELHETNIDLQYALPLRNVHMLLFGYFTISSYDKESDQVMLKFPNKEIEEAVERKLAKYIADQKHKIYTYR